MVLGCKAYQLSPTTLFSTSSRGVEGGGAIVYQNKQPHIPCFLEFTMLARKWLGSGPDFVGYEDSNKAGQQEHNAGQFTTRKTVSYQMDGFL